MSNPPKSSEELLLAFFTSLFLSSSIQGAEEINQYKMFSLNPRNNSNRSILYTQQNENLAILYAMVETQNYQSFSFPTLSINVSASPSTTLNDCSSNHDKSFKVGCRLDFPVLDQVVNLNHIWTSGSGPYVFVPAMPSTPDSIVAENTNRNSGQHSVTYLGGRIRASSGTNLNNAPDGVTDGSGVNLGFNETENGKLSFEMSLPKGTLANLVVVDY